MISVKEAVASARASCQEFFDGVGLVDLQLEEVQLNDREDEWLITLGFNARNMNPMRGLGATLGGEREFIRKYKVFHVDAQNGQVKAMKIREV